MFSLGCNKDIINGEQILIAYKLILKSALVVRLVVVLVLVVWMDVIASSGGEQNAKKAG